MRAKIAGRLQEPARQRCAGEHFRLLLSASRIFFVWAITTRLRARHEVTMSDEELEQDELETTDEDEGEELNAAEEIEGDGDAEAPAPTSKKAKQAVDPEELPSVEAKQKERDAIARAMEEYLSRGG